MDKQNKLNKKNQSVIEAVDLEKDVKTATQEDSSVDEFEIIDGEINFSSDKEDALSDSSTEEKTTTISSEEEEVLTDEQLNASEKNSKKQFYLTVYDLVSTVMGAFVIIALVFTFAFRLVGVDGESMTNTLQHGDWLLTHSKSEYEQGDIVVITQDTSFHKPLIKRVIAVGGQTINIDYNTATVYVDGVALDEPYVRESYLIQKGDYIQFPYTVPEGHLFCMGDNRNGSSDSRSTYVGSIDERQILGKAFIRILPFGDFDIYDYE